MNLTNIIVRFWIIRGSLNSKSSFCGFYFSSLTLYSYLLGLLLQVEFHHVSSGSCIHSQVFPFSLLIVKVLNKLNNKTLRKWMFAKHFHESKAEKLKCFNTRNKKITLYKCSYNYFNRNFHALTWTSWSLHKMKRRFNLSLRKKKKERMKILFMLLIGHN